MREHHLDGLRGWAALVVVLCHLGQNVFWTGWRPGFEVLFTDGSLAVFVFFVLSGYVLSIEFFRTGDRRVVFDLALRRYPRLTIPILGVCAVAAVMLSMGMMRNQAAAAASGSTWLSIFYRFDPSLTDLLNFSLFKVYIYTPSAISYNSSLWTMPTEMQGSILLFALLLLIGRSKSLRWCALSLAVVGMAFFQSSILGIAAGAFVAAFTQSAVHQRLRSSRNGTYLAWFLLLAGIGFAAIRPANLEPIWLTTCSLAILYAVLLDERLQRALRAPLSQWLGRLSFPLYLVHLLVICSFTSWAYVALGGGHPLIGIKAAALFFVSLGICLAMAMLFQPLEQFAIDIGRRLSRRVLRREVDELPDGRAA